MPAQASQMQCPSWSCCPGSLCPWRSRTVQDKPSPAQHRAWAGSPYSLCLLAENNGNPFRSTLGVSQLGDGSSPQLFLPSFSALLSFISGPHMPAVLCVCSLLLVTNSLVKSGVGALSQHIRYPLVLSDSPMDFRGAKNFQVTLTMRSRYSLPCPSWSVRWSLAACERAIL